MSQSERSGAELLIQNSPRVTFMFTNLDWYLIVIRTDKTTITDKWLTVVISSRSVLLVLNSNHLALESNRTLVNFEKSSEKSLVFNESDLELIKRWYRILSVIAHTTSKHSDGMEQFVRGESEDVWRRTGGRQGVCSTSPWWAESRESQWRRLRGILCTRRACHGPESGTHRSEKTVSDHYL